MFPFVENPENRERYSVLKDNLFTNMPEQEEPVQEQPARNMAPFSSIFSYEEEENRQKDMFKRREAVDQKIIRTNAIADAFRLITQGVGAGMGATIKKEAPNQNVIKAFDDYMALDDDRREALDRWRMFDWQNQIRDLDYQHQERAREDTQEHQTDLQGTAHGFRQEEALDEFGRKKEMAGTEHGYALEQQGAKDKAALDQIRERGKQSKELYGDYYNTGGGRSGNRKDLSIPGYGVIPGNQTGWASQVLADQFDVNTNDQGMLKTIQDDPILKAFLRNKDNLTDQQYTQLFTKYWHLIQPGYEAHLRATGQTGATNEPPPKKDTTETDQKIADAATRTDWSYRKKLKFITKAAMEGYGDSQAEAERRAKKQLGRE